MRSISRKDKKIAKKKRIKFFLSSLVLLLFVGAGAYLFISYSQKPLFISPLAQNVLGEASPDTPGIDILKKSLKDLRVDFDNISETNDSYQIHLKNKSQIILSKDKNIKSQISSLQFILTRLTMEGKLFTQLDLRFDKPIIRIK